MIIAPELQLKARAGGQGDSILCSPSHTQEAGVAYVRKLTVRITANEPHLIKAKRAGSGIRSAALAVSEKLPLG